MGFFAASYVFGAVCIVGVQGQGSNLCPLGKHRACCRIAVIGAVRTLRHERLRRLLSLLYKVLLVCAMLRRLDVTATLRHAVLRHAQRWSATLRAVGVMHSLQHLVLGVAAAETEGARMPGRLAACCLWHAHETAAEGEGTRPAGANSCCVRHPQHVTWSKGL